MTPKEALKGIKQAIAEHLHKQTGVNVEKHFEYLQYDTEIDIVDKALNDLERAKKVDELLRLYREHHELVPFTPGLGNKSELEELKRDVKRYFELLDKYTSNIQTTEEMHERWTLEDKLLKVGYGFRVY